MFRVATYSGMIHDLRPFQNGASALWCKSGIYLFVRISNDTIFGTVWYFLINCNCNYLCPGYNTAILSTIPSLRKFKMMYQKPNWLYRNIRNLLTLIPRSPVSCFRLTVLTPRRRQRQCSPGRWRRCRRRRWNLRNRSVIQRGGLYVGAVLPRD